MLDYLRCVGYSLSVCVRRSTMC